MNNPLVFVFLLIVSAVGGFLGLFYYMRPEKIVLGRVKEEHTRTAEKDPEFKKWLDSEVQAQINKTRKLGLSILVFEAIWMVLIFSMWQSGFKH